jgi:dolichol-phosphate mannosyltransferase
MIKSYSVILPTLNEAGHIQKLILDISQIFTLGHYEYEIIVIDDNSTDGTIDIVKSIQNENLNIKIFVREDKKKNLVESLKDGIKFSNYKYVIWLDADYSHPPEYINEFILNNNKNDYDILVFSRFLKDSKRYFSLANINPVIIDSMSIFLNKICQNLLFKDFTDYTSGYICIKKEKLSNFFIKGYYGDYFINLIVDAKIKNLKIKELPYIEKARASGYSKTTGDKFNFIVKCFFYFLAIIRSIIKKLIYFFLNKTKK